MIKQRNITVKTASATLTVVEMGDVVANSSSATTMALPTPSPGLWYRFSNANSGVVTISYNSSSMTALKQAEQCLCLSNGTSGWFFSKGGGAMTKSEIEAVLTGVISSHKHILSGSAAPTTATVAGFVGQFYLETTTPTLYQCTAISGSTYTWTQIGGGAGSYTLPQATESVLGGIKASTKTTETNEVRIDPSTGKLYCNAPTEATNGLPAGGATGQVLAKKSGTDYDASWKNPTVLSGTTAQRPQATKTDEYTKLLLHLNNDFSDACGKTVTAYGNAQISAAQSKFGGSSALFDGNGDYLRLADSEDWNFTGDFTVDCWIYFNSLPTGNSWPAQVPIFCQGPAGSSDQLALYVGSTTIRYCISDSTAIVQGNHGFNTNTWYHVALVRNGSSWNIYINGTSVASATNSLTLTNYSNPFDIFADDAGGSCKFNGYCDEYRVSKGIARWTANFTPPDSPYFWESVGLETGLQYFDTTLNKPIWSNGVSWVDAAGNVV